MENVAPDFPVLESLEAQKALVDDVQKSGQSAIIDKIICKDKESEEVSKNIELKAFTEVLHDESSPIEDVVQLASSLDLSLEKAQETRESLDKNLVQMKSEQVNPDCMLMLKVLSFSCIQFKLRKPKNIKSHLKAGIDQNLQRNM